MKQTPDRDRVFGQVRLCRHSGTLTIASDDRSDDLAQIARTGGLIPGSVAWALGGAVAALVFLIAEAAETLLAEIVQRRRGDPDAEHEQT